MMNDTERVMDVNMNFSNHELERVTSASTSNEVVSNRASNEAGQGKGNL
jgi:hypothetical protein